MRKAFLKALLESTAKNKKIMLLTGDLGFNVLEPFRDTYPEQFVNIGVAEENLIGVSSGLAAGGFIPFAYSIATFATMRAYEHIRNDVGIQNMPVKIVGVGAGLAYNKAGPTHHAIEDIALMRTVPNMTILAPCNEEETYQATLAAIDHKGPVYLRIESNPNGPTHKKTPFTIGKAQKILAGEKIAIITTGTKLPLAREVIKLLEIKHVTPSVFAFPTVKPLDTAALKKISKTHSIIAVIEEHRNEGGLGSAILEATSEFENRPHILRFGLKNEFPPISASYQVLMEEHGLTAPGIAKKIFAKIK